MWCENLFMLSAHTLLVGCVWVCVCKIPIAIALALGFCLAHLQTGRGQNYNLSVKQFVLFKKDKDDKPFREVLALH